MAESRQHRYTVIGLMSGSSAKGVDAALITTDGENLVEFHGGLRHPYGEELQSRILEASQHNVRLDELLRLEREITIHHSDAVTALQERLGKVAASAQLIGFHGHTVRHLASEGVTLQIGNPWLLAELTGLQVVSDFRRRDMARGGRGSPLASFFHQALFHEPTRAIGVLNLGGIANLTWLFPDGSIVAGDTGPGCGLLDEWVQEMAGLSHDIDGQLASRGNVQSLMVEEFLSTPYFQRPLPKSADRFEFDHIDVSGMSVEDGAATLCAVTVDAVHKAISQMPEPPGILWVTGGGVHHPVIMKSLRDRFPTVQTIDKRNLSPDMLEAECFAWLAVRSLRNLPLTIPETTGCSQPTTGGFVTP
ncbi:anhydro-N-acetylmuramic acid kinase [Bremerella sp. T1]|uniref:anhydro-N-acetylmuramic acid kinase n=1 Tax=Bremerella sp. TYQ1 TaxID=3119568 RepID=UPI001CCD1AD3|nr:anhydro-N-acetylmuramic acid kinase [Bremerella volcania]UBM37183.1 anhydro-N-acetylmuramic acid kinase [Bremerella volcania]